MKKNRMMRLACVLLICVMLTTSVISGTFAKYTSEATGTDTARVAKWSFTVGGTNITTEDTFTFNLWNYTDNSVDVNGKEDNAKVIAPGTSGSIEIALMNDSEVAAEYAVAFTASTVDIPIEYSLTGTDGPWETDITKLNTATDKEVPIAMNGGTDTVKLFWRWAFEANRDAADTKLGTDAVDAAQEIVVTATITATQVD